MELASYVDRKVGMVLQSGRQMRETGDTRQGLSLSGTSKSALARVATLRNSMSL